MKRLKAMSNIEWARRRYPKEIKRITGCPRQLQILGLDYDCLSFDRCSDCWNSPAKRNGKYIMKVVKE